MFTGLIETLGSIRTLEHTAGASRLTVSADPSFISRLHQGDSVAVSGVCLTALALDAQQGTFAADLAAETIARTSLSRLAPGSVVNLELPTPAGTPLGGHIVQGHVDGVGTLEAVAAVSPAAPENTDWRLTITLPADLMRFVVEKGSIAVEGISLTVAAVHGTRMEIAIIPHTWSATNLRNLPPGSPVNLEVDIMAKYAERRLERNSRSGLTITAEYLLANGY